VQCLHASCRQGITGLDDHRGDGIHGPWTLVNLNVHDNLIVSNIGEPGAGRSGVVDTVGTGAFSPEANNRYDRNTYALGSGSHYFVWLDAEATTSEWQAFGQDTNSTFDR